MSLVTVVKILSHVLDTHVRIIAHNVLAIRPLSQTCRDNDYIFITTDQLENWFTCCLLLDYSIPFFNGSPWAWAYHSLAYPAYRKAYRIPLEGGGWRGWES